MSDSVTLRKTRGTIWMIVSFILVAIATCLVGGIFFLSSFDVFVLLVFVLGFLTFTFPATYDCFVTAGQYLEKDEQKKKRNIALSEEDDEYEYVEQEYFEEELDSSSLQDSADLNRTYGIINLIIALMLFVAIVFGNFYIFLKDPIFLCMLIPESLIFVIIYFLVDSACDYFMEVGKYIEKNKKMMES